MKFAVAVVALSTLAIPSRIVAHSAGLEQNLPIDSATSDPPQIPAPETIPQPAPVFDRPISWKLLPLNLLRDQERIWTFPTRLVQGQNWVPTAAVLGTTTGLIAC